MTKQRLKPQKVETSKVIQLDEVIIESVQLQRRKDSLETFINSPEFFALTIMNRSLLKTQLGAMTCYLGVLESRLHLVSGFGGTV